MTLLVKTCVTGALLLVLLAKAAEDCESSWNYDQNGEDWSEDDSTQCGGSKQSPINVVPSNVQSELDSNTHGIEQITQITVSIDEEFEDDDSIMWDLQNNGHTLNLYPEQNDQYRMTGGILPSDTEYCLAQWHFHWGDSDNTGTEHQISGQVFPLDTHFVFYPCSFDSISDALDHSGDSEGIDKYVLAVINLMFEVVSDDDDEDEDAYDLSEITDALSDGLGYLNMTDIMLSKELFGLVGSHGDFYSYLGSLTTPNCNEIVRWHVIKQRLKVSSQVTSSLRSNVEDCNGDIITKNWRVVVPNSNPLWSYCTDEDLVGEGEDCTVDNTEDDSEDAASMLFGPHRMSLFTVVMLGLGLV